MTKTKKDKLVVLSAKVPESLVMGLKDDAKWLDTSVSQMVVTALTQYRRKMKNEVAKKFKETVKRKQQDLDR
jgi:hypothetical protein